MKKYYFKALVLLAISIMLVITTPVSQADSDVVTVENEHSVPCGKSLMLYKKVPNDIKVLWKSSDENILSVKNGIVNTKNIGKSEVIEQRVRAKKESDEPCSQDVLETRRHIIEVTAPELVKFTYTSPNLAVANSVVQLIAITEKNVKNIKFEVDFNSKIRSIPAQQKLIEDKTCVWIGKVFVHDRGAYKVSTLCLEGDKWNKKENSETTIYATSNGHHPILERRRMSDNGLRFIAQCEGIEHKICSDPFTKSILNIGHGHVIYFGEVFFDDITKREAYALLTKTVNEGNCSTELNDFLINNGINCTQNQFDALVSFSYNLGTGWIHQSDFKNVILAKSLAGFTGKVTSTDGLWLRSEPSQNSKKLDLLTFNQSVNLESDKKYNLDWYKVVTNDGKSGYCHSDYLIITSWGKSQCASLSNIDVDSLSYEILRYHHARKDCIRGLLYRRIEELEMFLYGNYMRDGYKNKHNFRMPECILSKLSK